MNHLVEITISQLIYTSRKVGSGHSYVPRLKKRRITWFAVTSWHTSHRSQDSVNPEGREWDHTAWCVVPSVQDGCGRASWHFIETCHSLAGYFFSVPFRAWQQKPSTSLGPIFFPLVFSVRSIRADLHGPLNGQTAVIADAFTLVESDKIGTTLVKTWEMNKNDLWRKEAYTDTKTRRPEDPLRLPVRGDLIHHEPLFADKNVI